MEREVLLDVKPLSTKVGDYKVKKEGFVVTVYRTAGRPIGRITLSPSGEHRGALWLGSSLAGEFIYSRGRWYVYAIENGRIAREARRTDPLSYLISRFEDRQPA